MTESLRDAIDDLARAFEEFKQANDQQLIEIKTRGGADAVTTAKVDRLNARLDKLSDELEQTQTALSRSIKGDAGPIAGRRTDEQKAFDTFTRMGIEVMTPEERKALTVSTDTTGGYLAPAEYVREIIKAQVEFSPMRTIARVRQTVGPSTKIPKRTGQFSAVWTSEQGTRSETDGLRYGMEDVPNHELYGLVDISQQNLEDSAFDLESELQAEFSEQFAVAEGAAFVSGTGVGKPFGFLSASDVGITNSGNASAVTADGMIDLYHAVKTAYARNGSWTLNRRTLGAVRKLKSEDNQYLWQPGLATLRPSTILDAPYVEVPDMPDVAAGAAVYPIAFGDFRRAYTIVDRVMMSVLRDPFTQATSGNVRFLARRRVGGQVVLAEAIRKLKIAA